MKLSNWRMAIPMAALAITAGLLIAPASSQAASAAPAHTTLSDRDLARLPLTDRNLNQHERANLATVLGAYHAAEGRVDDPAAFISSFTEDGIFNSILANQVYRGTSLGNVVTSTAAMFPDVHRDLRHITVRGDTVAIQLHIQGTFEGPLQTPAGPLKPTGAKVDYPTDDFFYLRDGKIQEFDCLIGLSAELSQLGVGFDWASAVGRG